MEKLFNKNFILIIIGKIISIVVNSLINFSLSLYILELTGSSETFGIVTAVCVLPWAIFAPVGGAIADKYNQRNIMIILDVLAGITILALSLSFYINGSVSLSLIVFAKLTLSGIGAAYSPAVLSALIYIVRKEDITRANSISSQVNSISSIIAPILAGILYSILKINQILLIAAFLFILSAIIEIFIKIEKPKDIIVNKSEKTDLKASFNYLINNKAVFRFLAFSSIINSAIASIIAVGLPVIINMYLLLPSEYYGVASGFVGLGSFFAGIILFNFSHKIKYNHSGIMYLFSSVLIICMGAVLLIKNSFTAFILLCLVILMLTIFTSATYILKNSFLQFNTPHLLVGKVLAITMIISGFFEPMGQAGYGYLFGIQTSFIPYILIFSGVFLIPISVILTRISKKLV